MADREHYTVEQLVEVLAKNMGKVYLAAQALGCSPQTIYNYLDRYPELRERVERERGEMIDLAECKLKQALLKKEPEAWAICFTLKTLGKHRGYVERVEQSGPGGGPLKVGVAPIDWNQLCERSVNGEGEVEERLLAEEGRGQLEAERGSGGDR